jgi:predicted TIM-barrel fold metal-dependent hydrolase
MSQTQQPIIDAHLHLFDRALGQYAWLKSDNPPFWPDKHLLDRDFSESDLVLSKTKPVLGFVHIEAGFNNAQPYTEIDWLQKTCRLPFRSVAFADLNAANFVDQIDRLQARRSVVGIRHILDEQAVAILSASTLPKALALLAQRQLSFDAQLSLADSPAIDKLLYFAGKHQELDIIINHAGWPFGKTEVSFQPQWQYNIKRLANFNNIAIKLSGWEMTDRAWQADHVKPILVQCLESLGPERVMLASNFPLCTLSCSYAQLWQRYHNIAADDGQLYRQLTYSNALKWYKFNPTDFIQG